MAKAAAWVMIPTFNKDIRECVIDIRPLVLCKDCTYWDDSTNGRYVGGWCFCDKLQFSTSPDWYCADGVREDDGNAAD